MKRDELKENSWYLLTSGKKNNPIAYRFAVYQNGWFVFNTPVTHRPIEGIAPEETTPDTEWVECNPHSLF